MTQMKVKHKKRDEVFEGMEFNQRSEKEIIETLLNNAGVTLEERVGNVWKINVKFREDRDSVSFSLAYGDVILFSPSGFPWLFIPLHYFESDFEVMTPEGASS